MLGMADCKGSSSAVFCQKDNQQPIMQTSSAVERPRCLTSNGKKDYKPERMLQRERIPSYFYEGHQKSYHTNTSKDFEGLSNLENLQYDKLKSNKRYCPSKAVDEVTATYDKIERQMLAVRPPMVMKQPPNANLLQAMQSNKQSLAGIQTVTHGKPGLNMMAFNNKNQNQSSETVEGNSLKIANLESLVNQPAMMEVLRSSKEKIEPNESDIEALSEEESSCDCGVVNGDKGDGPSSGYYRQARNQTTVNDKPRNDGKYQQNQQVLQENTIPSIGIKGQFKRNDRQNINRPLSENDNMPQAIPEITDKSRKSSIGRPFSSPRSNSAASQGSSRQCPLNRQEPLNKKPDIQDMPMPFTVNNGKADKKSMPCPSNRMKQVPFCESILSNDKNELEQVKQQQNQKLKLSNLDSVTIQSGMPAMMRVHQNLTSNETSPQDSGEEQQNLESENEKECFDSEYDQISTGDNQLSKIPEPQIKNSNGFKAGSNERHSSHSNRRSSGDRSIQKNVTNDTCQDHQPQPYYGAPQRYQTQTMYEGKYTDQIPEFESRAKKQIERQPQFYKKSQSCRPNVMNNVRQKLHQALPTPPPPPPPPPPPMPQYQTMPSKRQMPNYMPPQHYPCTAAPEYYQCPAPVLPQNQQNLRKYKNPRAPQYHPQSMHCRPSPDGQFAEPVHPYPGLQYQQYMYPPQHSPIPSQPYVDQQYPVQNSQPDVNQYQQMQHYEQAITPINYQDDYDDSIADTHCCENYATQQYVGEHMHAQYDYYNNSSNYYAQGQQNAFCGSDYYDGVYE